MALELLMRTVVMTGLTRDPVNGTFSAAPASNNIWYSLATSCAHCAAFALQPVCARNARTNPARAFFP